MSDEPNSNTISKELAGIREIVNTTSNAVSALAEVVKSHESKFQSNEATLERKFQATDAALAGISRRAVDDNKTPWFVIIGAFTIALSVISYVGNLAGTGMWRAIDGNTEARDKLDTSLQREMRDVTAILEAEVKGLEDKLASENILRDRHITDKFNTLTVAVAAINKWLDEHKAVNGLNAAQWERIRALERGQYGKSLNIEFK